MLVVMRVSLLLHASWLVSIAHVTVQQPLNSTVRMPRPSARTTATNNTMEDKRLLNMFKASVRALYYWLPFTFHKDKVWEVLRSSWQPKQQLSQRKLAPKSRTQN